AVAAVAGLHEPVEAPRRVGLVGRLLHELLHRDRAVRAGRVVVEVAADVAAGGARRGRGDRDGGAAEGGDGGDRDVATGEDRFHGRPLSCCWVERGETKERN